MKLPGNFNRLFKKKEKQQNLLLAILFEQARVTAAVFSSIETEAKILSFRQAPYDGEIADSVEVIDHLLAGLADEVSEVEELNNTIFGFPKEFIDQDKVKPAVLDKLKKIVKQLSLKPKGFVVLSEALAYYLSSQSGTQESAIFVGVFPSEVRISLLKIGKIIDEKTVARTNRLCFDVEEALNSFKQEVLPAKIILYDSTQTLESVKEEFLNYPWEKKCNFLHFPKIDILPSFASLEAVVSAYTKKKIVVFEEEPSIADTEDTKTVEPEELGFSSSLPPPAAELTNVEAKDESLSYHKRFLHKFRFNVSSLSLSSLPEKRMIVFLFGVLLIIGAAWWYITMYTVSAQVRILVDTQSFNQELEFTLDPEASTVNTEARIIPGKELSIELKGEESIETTGTTLIGDPAQGKVTVYNKTTKQKTFGKGEKLLSKGSVAFTLDEELKAASASESVDALKFGKAVGSVTAVDIGPEGNLSSGTEFVFENYSKDKYIARSAETFTGGTSREVSVVSKDDVSQLRKRMLAKLRKKAKQKLESQKEANYTVLDETIEEKISDESLSTEIGKQAKTVTLKATIKFTALAFKSEDITKLLQENAQSKIPSGFVMQGGKSRQKILDKTVNKDGSVEFRSSFATSLIPDIKVEKLRHKASGMGVRQFEDYLRKQKNIKGFEIVFAKGFSYFSPHTLPNDPSKISITVVTR